jgi:hypothetical protein
LPEAGIELALLGPLLLNFPAQAIPNAGWTA